MDALSNFIEESVSLRRQSYMAEDALPKPPALLALGSLQER